MRFWASFAAIACIAALASAPLGVRGDEPTADDKRAAAHAFDDGEKAFAAGDYLRAAELFEEANKKAPHYANVWNAARAYHKLGELARAATLYGRYLRIAPADAPIATARPQPFASSRRSSAASTSMRHPRRT